MAARSEQEVLLDALMCVSLHVCKRLEVTIIIKKKKKNQIDKIHNGILNHMNSKGPMKEVNEVTTIMKEQ